jgi:hypothetical protein
MPARYGSLVRTSTILICCVSTDGSSVWHCRRLAPLHPPPTGNTVVLTASPPPPPTPSCPLQCLLLRWCCLYRDCCGLLGRHGPSCRGAVQDVDGGSYGCCWPAQRRSRHLFSDGRLYVLTHLPAPARARSCTPFLLPCKEMECVVSCISERGFLLLASLRLSAFSCA